MSYKFKPVSVVSVIVTVGSRFLIVEERLGNGLPVYNTPSGHLEHWENLVQGAQRELFEETGIVTDHFDGIVGIYNLVQDSYTLLRTVFCLRLDNFPELKNSILLESEANDSPLKYNIKNEIKEYIKAKKKS